MSPGLTAFVVFCLVFLGAPALLPTADTAVDAFEQGMAAGPFAFFAAVVAALGAYMVARRRQDAAHNAAVDARSGNAG